ncbi:MAG TPA: N-acetylmuramoyl-L-alanine amidase [Terriglobales bacterium]|nr:N-acetylmuramoyl-L-alanine amidase [Terriglobales bacterium]
MALLITSATSLPASAAARNKAASRQRAQAQFEKAEKSRKALSAKPTAERKKVDYQRAIAAYWQVYRYSPASPRANEALWAMAELKTDMGRIFGDRATLEAAIDQYEFLRREYPGSRYRFEALLREGQIYRHDLADAARARATFEDFLKRYPSHPLAKDAQTELEEMRVEATRPKPTPAPPKQIKPDEPRVMDAAIVEPPPASDTDKERKGRVMVTNIRHWSTPDYTRVAIDLEQEVKYEAGRLGNPDRIFFDLHNARLAPELLNKSLELGADGFLQRVRVGQFQKGITRVVLEVNGVSQYSAFFLPNPYRLVIDVHGSRAAETQVAAKPAASSAPTPGKTTTQEKNKPVTVEIAKAAPPPASPPVAATATPEVSLAKEQEIKATTKPTTAPVYESVAPRAAEKESREARHTKAKPPAETTVALGRPAKPTTSGETSLTRALGLKIGRIVIDAGHGGHDTGTIGRKGLAEKDLTLDLALRLGRLLEDRLGAEVIYTRTEDVFVPLENRTAIANKAQADLFLSIHANSSRDRSARGVETYYLNFTSSPDALEVAARENAVSEASIHELQDLVKKITLTEKIEESREFASAVQQSLAQQAKKNAGMRSRGVKKAPFVVLIGANMPSILAEVSFLSNPSDEKNLNKSEYRQRLAEALFHGVSSYAEGLSGVKLASKSNAAAP